MKSPQGPQFRLLIAAATLLALSALLGGVAGCGSATVELTPTPTRTPHMVASPPPAPTPPPTTTPTATRSPTINPLTGEDMGDVALLDRVPVAIKISNYPPVVRPQAGINSADLIFEHYNEGWFATRWTAVYLGKDPQQVGSVRSGRIIDLEIPAMYDAVLACSGFSPGVLELIRNSDLYPERVASPSVGVGAPVFYRDANHSAPHNMFTNPELVRTWAAEQGLSGRQELEGMVFSDQPPQGEAATVVKIPWRQMPSEWRYDEASGRYLRWTDGAAHKDALDGKQLSAANLVLLYVPQWNTEIIEDFTNGALSIRWALWDVDNPYRPAILLRDGQRIDCRWSRPTRDDLLVLEDQEGNPIPFKPGNTFFEILPAEGMEVVIEP